MVEHFHNTLWFTFTVIIYCKPAEMIIQQSITVYLLLKRKLAKIRKWEQILFILASASAQLSAQCYKSTEAKDVYK